MESLGWRAWVGKPGMESLGWRAWDGEPGIESLKNDEFLWVDIQEWRACGGGPWVESLGFFLSGCGKVVFKKVRYQFCHIFSIFISFF